MSVEDVTEILPIHLLGAIPDDEQVVIATNQGEPVQEMIRRQGPLHEHLPETDGRGSTSDEYGGKGRIVLPPHTSVQEKLVRRQKMGLFEGMERKRLSGSQKTV